MLKRVIQVIVIILFVGFVVLQFIRPDMTNPPVVAEQTMESSMPVPENVKTILSRSCADCHTNTTSFPWYAQISPVSWYLVDHIKEGRRELNMSEWATYNDRKKKKKLEEVCEQVETREMPLPSYLWIHRDAQMSDEDIKVLCDWAKAESAKFPAEVKQNK